MVSENESLAASLFVEIKLRTMTARNREQYHFILCLFIRCVRKTACRYTNLHTSMSIIKLFALQKMQTGQGVFLWHVPIGEKGLLLCQRICIVSMFIAKILKIILDISLKNSFWSVWVRFRLACLLYDGGKSIGSKSEGWILQWPPQRYLSISIRVCWGSLRIWKINKNCGRVEAVKMV